MLASLAKIDPAHLAFRAAADIAGEAEAQQSDTDQISVVVADGLHIQLPMAGTEAEYVWMLSDELLQMRKMCSAQSFT